MPVDLVCQLAPHALFRVFSAFSWLAPLSAKSTITAHAFEPDPITASTLERRPIVAHDVPIVGASGFNSLLHKALTP
jgi:hypothetical protein